MSETLQPALPDQLDEQAERLMRRLCDHDLTVATGPGQEEGLVHMALARRDGSTEHRVEHFGPRGRGAIRVATLKTMLEMLERALGQE